MEGSATITDRTLPKLDLLAARGVFYLIVLIVIVGLVWSSVARINVVVRAEGRLSPRAEPLKLSASQGGVVSKVTVAVGDKVSAGKALLELDAFREAAEAASDRHQLEEAMAEEARFAEAARMLDAANAKLKQELTDEQNVVDLMVKQVGALREGFSGGAVSLFELQAKEREITETKAQMSRLQSDLARSEAVSAEDRRKETETTLRIKTLEVKLSRDLEVKQKTVLSAPVAGIVTGISSLRPGRYLAANEVAVTMIPGDEPLMAEIWIPNASMRRVKPSLPVRIKMKAYPFQQFGVLLGTLESVDPDADQSGAYRAWIKPDRLSIMGPRGPELLRPGLALTAEIVVDERTILDVILDPIRGARRGFSISA